MIWAVIVTSPPAEDVGLAVSGYAWSALAGVVVGAGLVWLTLILDNWKRQP